MEERKLLLLYHQLLHQSSNVYVCDVYNVIVYYNRENEKVKTFGTKTKTSFQSAGTAIKNAGTAVKENDRVQNFGERIRTTSVRIKVRMFQGLRAHVICTSFSFVRIVLLGAMQILMMTLLLKKLLYLMSRLKKTDYIFYLSGILTACVFVNYEPKSLLLLILDVYVCSLRIINNFNPLQLEEETGEREGRPLFIV